MASRNHGVISQHLSSEKQPASSTRSSHLHSSRRHRSPKPTVLPDPSLARSFLISAAAQPSIPTVGVSLTGVVPNSLQPPSFLPPPAASNQAGILSLSPGVAAFMLDLLCASRHRRCSFEETERYKSTRERTEIEEKNGERKETGRKSNKRNLFGLLTKSKPNSIYGGHLQGPILFCPICYGRLSLCQNHGESDQIFAKSSFPFSK